MKRLLTSLLLTTYYLLQQLQQNGGHVTLGDLSDQVTKYVGRTSIVENDKSQTPVLLASTTAQDWRKWVLAHKRANQAFAAVYMTGILPIKKYKTESALNNFTEYSMVEPRRMARYFGFTSASSASPTMLPATIL